MTGNTAGSPTPKERFLSSLRAKTSEEHSALETLPVSAALMSSNVSLKHYCDYLQLMHAAHRDAEQHLYPILSGQIPDLDKRMKAFKIEADLLPLASTIPVSESRPLTGYPGDLTTGFALGMLYVMEGSSLGGRVILKHVMKSLPVTSSRGASYFEGYGDDTGPMWKSFLNHLCDWPHSQEDEEEIIAGARTAFSRLYDHMK